MPRVPFRDAADPPVTQKSEPYSSWLPGNENIFTRRADTELAAPSISFKTSTMYAATNSLSATRTQGDPSPTSASRNVDFTTKTVSLARGITTTYSYALSSSPQWPPVTTTTTAAGPPDLMGELPDLPPLVTFFFFAWLAFAWMLAVFLYFSQFPEQLEWLCKAVGTYVRRVRGIKDARLGEDEARGRHRKGYVVLPNDDRNVLVDGTQHSGEHTSRKKRKATDHSKGDGISTALPPNGLGILLPRQSSQNDSPPTPTIRLRKPRSFDDLEAHNTESDDKARRRSKAMLTNLTAPLPSIGTFSPLSPSRKTSYHRLAKRTDLEDGLHTPGSAASSGSEDERDRVACDGKGRGLITFLGSVNAGIESMAGTMARLAYDHVGGDGPEAGLLLPVRQGDREPEEMASVG